SGWCIRPGPFAGVRGLYLLSIGQITWENPPEWARWVALSKAAFLLLYGLVLLGARRRPLLHGIVATLLLFQVVYAGVASQYLIWAVPFLLLAERRAMFWCYEAAATYALVIFYWIFFPDILWGTLAPPPVGFAPMLRQYVGSQALLSIVCAAGVLLFATRTAAGAAPVSADPSPAARWRPAVVAAL